MPAALEAMQRPPSERGAIGAALGGPVERRLREHGPPVRARTGPTVLAGVAAVGPGA